MAKSQPGRRRSTSTLAPLQPSLDRSIPAPSGRSPEHPTVVPDIRAEEVLFRLYLDQKAKADYWRDKARLAEKKFAAFRAGRLAHGISKNLKPSHNDHPTGRKVR